MLDRPCTLTGSPENIEWVLPSAFHSEKQKVLKFHCCSNKDTNLDSSPITSWITWRPLSPFATRNSFCVEPLGDGRCPSSVLFFFLFLFWAPTPLPAGRPRGCWVRSWSSVATALAFTTTWTATAPFSKFSSLLTKSASSSAKEERPSNSYRFNIWCCTSCDSLKDCGQAELVGNGTCKASHDPPAKIWKGVFFTQDDEIE